MYYKKTHDWIRIGLWTGVVLVLAVLIYALWYRYLDLSIGALIALLALLLLLAYCKYAQIMAIRKKFVIVQESFTTIMLVYFSYAYFSGSQTLPGEKLLKNTRRKFDEVYDKSRYQLTMPLVMTGLKTFGEITSIKNIIMSEIKNFGTSDGFTLNNAESITSEVGKLAQKLGQLSDLVAKGFSSKKSMEDIIDEKPKPAKPKPFKRQPAREKARLVEPERKRLSNDNKDKTDNKNRK